MPYDGAAHTASYTVAGVNSEGGATVGTVALTTTHTNAGTYAADTWSFTGAGIYDDILGTAYHRQDPEGQRHGGGNAV